MECIITTAICVDEELLNSTNFCSRDALSFCERAPAKSFTRRGGFGAGGNSWAKRTKGKRRKNKISRRGRRVAEFAEKKRRSVFIFRHQKIFHRIIHRCHLSDRGNDETVHYRLHE